MIIESATKIQATEDTASYWVVTVYGRPVEYVGRTLPAAIHSAERAA
jgi:hypothetical protein